MTFPIRFKALSFAVREQLQTRYQQANTGRSLTPVCYQPGCLLNRNSFSQVLIGGVILLPSALQWGRLFFSSMSGKSMASEDQSQEAFSIAYVTTPNEEVARTLATDLVKDKLAACVNIIPTVHSIYEWKNEIQSDTESLMVIKTRTSRIEEVTAFVRKNHPYEVCEVISVPIQHGNPPYMKWLGEIVADKKTS